MKRRRVHLSRGCNAYKRHVGGEQKDHTKAYEAVEAVTYATKRAEKKRKLAAGEALGGEHTFGGEVRAQRPRQCACGSGVTPRAAHRHRHRHRHRALVE